MNSTAKIAHDEKVDSLANTYVKQGFTVIKEPSTGELPFDLGDYTPDLIATKGDTGLMIEVKTKASLVSIDRFQSLPEEISSHPGWRFLLVTLDDVDVSEVPTTSNQLPTWQSLQVKVHKAQDLVAEDALKPALLYLWSIFEAAMRKRAIAQNIPVERLPASMLLNHMYSQGEVPVEDIDLFREFMRRRNLIAHGANVQIAHDQVTQTLQAILRLLREWSVEESENHPATGIVQLTAPAG